MRTIEWTGQFKRDYKREAKGKHRATLDAELFPVITALANDQVLDSKYRDHGLIGNWKDHRDCHIKPDLILIYRVQEADALGMQKVPIYRLLVIASVAWRSMVASQGHGLPRYARNDDAGTFVFAPSLNKITGWDSHDAAVRQRR